MADLPPEIKLPAKVLRTKILTYTTIPDLPNEIQLPALWKKLTDVEFDALSTEPDKLRNQDFAHDVVTLYTSLKEVVPIEEITGVFFISEEQECFVLNYSKSNNNSNEIVSRVIGSFQRRLMPNVETLICDRLLAFLIAAKKNRSRARRTRPIYEADILVRH